MSETPSHHMYNAADRPRGWVAPIAAAIFIAAGVCRPADAQSSTARKVLRLTLHASDSLPIAKSIGSGDPYDSMAKLVLDQNEENDARLTAYEENRFFIYAVGGTSGAGANSPGSLASTSMPRVMRRVIILKPSAFIVEDEVMSTDPQTHVEWSFDSTEAPRRDGEIKQGGWMLACETIFPREAIPCPTSFSGEGRKVGRSEISSPDKSGRTRFLHLLEARPVEDHSPRVRSEFTQAGGQWKLTLETAGRIFHLTLPPPDQGAGQIAVTTADGKPLSENRPLAAGILPHGPEGVRLMEQWDADYRGKQPPAWDIGKPADELQKVVGGGRIHPCRVIDLCCGSGTDAIYLASKGYQVTAIDIAPTALGQAERKARAAGVSVDWLLASVLAPPSLAPFDFIYDRGCYHVVRDQNLPAYLETLRRFSHPGTEFLLLAARAEDQGATQGHSGVTEEELRFDLLPLFEVEWLREIRLESNEPGIAPPGWSVLLRRFAKK